MSKSFEMICVTYENEEGDEVVVELPTKYEVCDRCEGHGTHLTPSIGQHAYSAEEFAEAFDDEEDREAYFRRGGKYDVACEECGGKRVVSVVDEDACTGALAVALKAHQEQEREEWESGADERAEARYFAAFDRDTYC